VCYHASFNFPAFIYVFGADEWPRFQSLYHKLTKINDARIKKTLSCSIHEIAKILGPKYTEQDLLPCLERFLKDKTEKANEIKQAVLKNLHIFLSVVSEDKRSGFIKYIVQTFDETPKSEWRLKQVLASNLGNYCELFEREMVYQEFLPMFFKFCSDNVAKVSMAAVSAICPILMKFNEDEKKQESIARIVKHRYCKSRTFKKRQLFVLMMNGQMMQQKEIFEKYFKIDFLLLVNDRVDNVRINMAKVLRYHFLKEISGVFVYDQEVNDAIKLLKFDKC
jgi:serine/threonine-protein phosphatase 4 regulatory subunit 1